jgi:hypothetical protein
MIDVNDVNQNNREGTTQHSLVAFSEEMLCRGDG